MEIVRIINRFQKKRFQKCTYTIKAEYIFTVAIIVAV